MIKPARQSGECPFCHGRLSDGHYCPSPEEIAEKTRELQANWTPVEEMQHRCGMASIARAKHWQPPECEVLAGREGGAKD